MENICIYIYIYMYIYVYIYICVCACVGMCVRVCRCVCVYIIGRRTLHGGGGQRNIYTPSEDRSERWLFILIANGGYTDDF